MRKLKRLTRKSLDELAKVMPTISELRQREFIGGNTDGYVGLKFQGKGSRENPYTVFEAGVLQNNSNYYWGGGYVKDNYGYVSYSKGTPAGMYDSHYIGQTSDAVMNTLPIPRHAADYIAQQHDLAYQAQGLSGFVGTWNSGSREADDRLLYHCHMLQKAINRGDYSYEGYPITGDSIKALSDMKLYFSFEQAASGLWQNN